MFVSGFHVLVLSILIGILYRHTDSGNFFRNGTPEAARLQRILLVTAHPDDECLFFAPTLLALTDRSRIGDASIPTEMKKTNDARENEVFSLCLSVGDADGLGGIRREEYEKSLDILGVKKSNRMVLDDPSLQDSMAISWDAEYIADVVERFVREHNITTLLTFDRGGVSGHPNHNAIPLGIQHMMKTYSSPPPPRFYMLITVPLSIKYVGILAPLVAKFDLCAMDFLSAAEDRFASMLRLLGVANGTATASANAKSRKNEAMPVFIAGIREYTVALQAMRKHWSQLVWFRWLNVMFSRYMWVNEWAEVVFALPEYAAAY